MLYVVRNMETGNYILLMDYRILAPQELIRLNNVTYKVISITE